MIVALAGNPNAGKTTLFNRLTGSHQRTGNLPGVTVERTSGGLRGHRGVTIVDLPGVYSLRSYTPEERVAADFLCTARPDVILHVADAGSLARGLYLTLQLLGLGIPVVLALNMMDELAADGGYIDTEELSRRLGVPVLPISALREQGLEELADEVVRAARTGSAGGADYAQGPVLDALRALERLAAPPADAAGLPRCHAAERLLERDPEIEARLALAPAAAEAAEAVRLRLESACGMDTNAALADARYAFLDRLCRDCVRVSDARRQSQRTRRIDRIVTSRWLGVPLFLAVMLGVFLLSFASAGAWLSERLSLALERLGDAAALTLLLRDAPPAWRSFVCDGLLSGVGSVLRFLPLILLLFFCLSLLEDSGYLARAAFLFDRPLRPFGLSGRSVVPLLLGLGCTVPAVLAARTLPGRRERTLTVLFAPFMSCSARMQVYALFSAAFFPQNAALVMGLLYGGGVLAGLFAAALLNLTALRGESAPFLLELPEYRLPSPQSVLLLLGRRASDFLRRAFGPILLAGAAVWFLQSFDGSLRYTANGDASLLAALGGALAPLFRPLGFGDWRAVTALVTGFLAKETVVSTLGVLTGGSLAAVFCPASAAAFLCFVLLYTPCVAAVAAMRRELGSAALTAAAVLGQCTLAWGAAWAVYQFARVLL